MIWTYAKTSGNTWANHANDSHSFDGSFYMQVGSDENGTSGAGLYQIIAGVAGYSYSLSVESAVQNWWWPQGEMRVAFLDASSNVLSKSVSSVTAGITSYDTGLPWRAYTMSAISPPGTAFVKVELASQSGSGTVFFDNVILTNAPSTVTVLPPTRILPLGDSITWGQPVPGGYRLPLYQLLTSAGFNVDFVGNVTANGASGLPDSDHEGHQSYLINDIISNFPSWISTVSDPDIILLLIGTNDYGFNFDTANAINRLDQLISLIVATRPNAKVVVANVTLRTDDPNRNNLIQTTFNAYVPGVVANHAARGQQVYFVDMRSALQASDLSDGLHPNQSGYNKMAAQWFNVVTNLFSPLGSFDVPAIVQVAGGANYSSVLVTFNKPVSASATNLVNYSLNGGLAILNATLDPVRQRTVTLTTSQQTPGHLYTLTVNNVMDVTANQLTIGPGTTATFRSVPPNTIAPVISNIFPNGAALFQVTNALGFTVSSSNGIATGDIGMALDGVNLSGLSFSGSSANWNVSYTNLATNRVYVASITTTDIYGNTSTATVNFDTFQQNCYSWEAEDYDYNGGHYFDNPQVGSYANLGATAGVDLNDVNLNGTYVYRPSGMATEIAADLPRGQFSGKNDYNIGFFSLGEWVNYTRHYPAGTYNVWGRFAAGGGNTKCYLDQVISGFGTANQSTNFLGTFNITNSSWSSFKWASLRDNNGNLVKLALNGAEITLRLARPDPSTGLSDVNVNFLILVPDESLVPITASDRGGEIGLSFPTQTGCNYQVLYKNNLNDTLWTPLGSSITGNGAFQTINDTKGAITRFYRVQIQ